MASVTIGSGFDMGNLNAYEVETGKRSLMMPTQFVFEDPASGIKAEVFGSGFTYDQWGWSGGLANKVIFSKNESVLMEANNISADASFAGYDNGYEGNFGFAAEVAYWLRGSDVITSSAENDTLKGFAGDDRFIASAGNDFIDGGAGSDTVEFAGNRQDFTVKQNGTNYTVSNSQYGSDTLTNVEFLKFNDQTISIAESFNNNQPSVSKTAEFLQSKFQISIDAARAWVIDRLNTPGEIYNICVTNNITTEMLAEIVQPSVPNVTSKQVAQFFLAAYRSATMLDVRQFDGVTLRGDSLNNNMVGTSLSDDLQGGDGNDSLYGDSGNDSLVGDWGTDILDGGAGNDMLISSWGSDVLTGGAGTDYFRFGTIPYMLNGSVNTITDFSVADDFIGLSRTVMPEIVLPNGGNDGILNPDAFIAGAGQKTALDASDRIIYDTTTGNLYFDGDGSGAKYSAIKILVIGTTTHPALTNADLMVTL